MVTYKHNEPYYKLILDQVDEEKLKILSFEGEESISDLFKYEIELVSEDPEIDSSKILNQKATFEITRGDEDPILIHGIISQFEQRGRSPDYVSYYAVLVPKLWRLNLTFRNEVYQFMDIENLVSTVLNDSGLSGSDYKFDLTESYPELEYVVQYKETNLNFIKRKLEHFGIFFFFDHSGDNDVVVFTDSNDNLKKINQSEDIFYNPNKDPLSESETISELTCSENIVTGAVKLKDYNYQFPEKQLVGESQIDSNSPGTYYDYGDNFKDEGEAESIAKIRNQEILAQSKIFKGTSDCRLFRAGNIYKMGKHYRDSWNSDYILINIISRGSQQGLFGILPKGKKINTTYENHFSAIPVEKDFRPQRKTPIPKVSGIMSAKIESSAGDEYAFMDDQGRYKAKMLFDLADKNDAESSSPIRLSQPYSGAGYGMHFPNHAGTEVLWACVDGNVDRPIGLGTVPNPSNTSPSTSSNKSQGVIRTAGDNEIILDDKGGKEQIHIKQKCGNEILMDAEGPNIEIKQKCGNEIHMNGKGGSEGITMEDKFNNKVVLDSVGKKINLSSPSKNTSIELGPGGIVQKTDQDWNISALAKKYEHIAGNVEFKVDGINHKIHGGYASDTFLGVKHSKFAGLQTSMSLSKSVSTTHGTTTTFRKARETRTTNEKIENIESFFVLKVGKHFDVDAKDEINLHVGDSSIRMGKDRITIEAASIILDGHVKIKKNCAIDGDLDSGGVISGKK